MNRALRLILFATLICAASFAQTGVGEIQGVASDVTGAVIPNAAVSLEDAQTGSRFETKTSDAGFFVFPALKSGEYKLSIVSAGLQRWEGKVTLRVGQQAVVQASLQMSQSVEQVTVVGNVSQLLTTTSP